MRYAFEVGLMHPFTHMIEIFVHSLHLRPVADSSGGKLERLSWLLPCRQRKRQNQRISEVMIYP